MFNYAYLVNAIENIQLVALKISIAPPRTVLFID